MKEFSATTTIKAPPETVWAILTDLAQWPSFDPSVARIEGTLAIGETIKLINRRDPKRAFPIEVTDIDPPTGMSWTAGVPLGLFKGVRRFRVEPLADGGTRLSVSERFTGPLLPIIGRSLDLNGTFRAFCAGLKARAESVRQTASNAGAPKPAGS